MSNVGTIWASIQASTQQASKIVLHRHKLIIGIKYQNNLHLLATHQSIQGSEMGIKRH